jgi:putative inorganic carbon (HCO3(-)) transporter
MDLHKRTEALHLEEVASSPVLRERTLERVWKLQGYGLLVVTFMSFFPQWFHWQEYLFFTLLAVALWATWSEGSPLWVRTPIDLPLFLLVSWVLVTVPFATDPAYSFAEWRKLATQGLVFYWAVLVFKRNGTELSRSWMLQAVLLGTALLCAYAVADFVVRGGSWKDRYIRAGAPNSDYNWLSTYLVIALPLLLAGGILGRDRWQRVASWAAAGLAFAAQVIAYTRAGWLGLAAQGLAFGVLTSRRKWAWGVLGACLLVTLCLVGASKLGYQQGTVDPWTFNARLDVWKLGVAKIMEHPLVGLGYGNYTFMMLFDAYPEIEKAPGPHSLFLMVAMGSGIPALALLLWTLGTAVLALVRAAWGSLDRHASLFMIAVALVIVGFTVRNIFDYMFAGSLGYLFWMIVAAGLTQSQQASPKNYFLTPEVPI